ncbi:replication protein [Candidatus Methylocalor cossyra]|uniref:Replication protein n=1 Tax=Candidatus Methylocalor cossyra TaxID=3108543 RepID=A0ABM9NN76_9GAMM
MSRKPNNPDLKVLSPFNNRQLDLFRSFLCSEADREKLSNAIDLWDSIPRYSVSRQEQNKRRDASGALPVLVLNFEYRGRPYTAEILPAKIKDADGTTRDYYPSANEELVEDALRKLATRQNRGFFEPDKFRSGVAFSLYELREELAARHHARSYQEIIQSLLILRRAGIVLRTADGDTGSFAEASYLPALAAVTRRTLKEDPNARWVVQFHPLVTQSIDQVTYRQFNYEVMMTLSSQLARWLHKQLTIKFTFAGLAANPFEMRYTTIKRDSCLLNRNRERDNIRDVEEALSSLVAKRVLREVQRNPITAARGKIVEVIYRLYPTSEFVKEIKAANKRLQDAKIAVVGLGRGSAGFQ